MSQSHPLADGDITLLACVNAAALDLTQAGVAFGHGTTNAFDEAAWLVLWQLGLPLDTPLDKETPQEPPNAAQSHVTNVLVTPAQQAQVATLLRARIRTRKPAAYLTKEAWLQGVAFYVDERAIVPRSLIAEVLVEGSLDYWLTDATHRVLDLCTGNGSLAVLAAMIYPDVFVQATDISADALEVARINVERHGLQQRISLRQCDGLPKTSKQFDLIVCNPPYVNARSMAELPPEFKAEPALALDGNHLGGTDGMDFIRQLLAQASACMSQQAILVIEIGHERAHFEAAFPFLEVYWLATSAGEDQVLLVTREALLAHSILSSEPTAGVANTKFSLKPVISEQDYEVLKSLLQEYAAKDLANAANSTIWKDLQDLPGRYGPPHGAALLAYAGDDLAGCGALAATAQSGVAEIKRIYVRQPFRRQGLARALTVQLVAQARSMAYVTAAISTWPENARALALYRELGFTPIAPFKIYPHASLVFLGVPLGSQGPATPQLSE